MQFLRRLAVAAAVSVCALSAPAFDAVFMTEQLKEKVVCTDTGCTEVETGKFDATAYVSLSDSFISDLDEQSTLTVILGDFVFSAHLGDDPNYDKGDTQALFQTVVSTTSGTLIVQRVKANWSNGTLRVKVKGVLPFADSPVAESLIGTSTGAKDVDAPIVVEIDTASDSKSVARQSAPFFAVVRRKTKTVDNVPYELVNIKVSGLLLP
jgi:hypothetical protein